MGVFAFMNREIVKSTGAVHENAQIILKSDGQEVKLGFDQITQLGEKEFTAIFDSSDTKPQEHSYTGVPLMNIIKELNVDIENIEQIIVRGIDGYTVALNPKEVMEEDNVYLAYKLNGKLLKGKQKGGSGPYQIIIRKDEFSQRWCKFVVEIELK